MGQSEWLLSSDMGCLFTAGGNKIGWRRRTETLRGDQIGGAGGGDAFQPAAVTQSLDLKTPGVIETINFPQRTH